LAINELLGEKSAIKIMYNRLIVNWWWKTTFELIDNYLPNLIGDLVNESLICGGKLAVRIL